MRINHLRLHNIGPFIDAEIDFIGDNDKPPVTIITGENGTGKTIVLDAIRKMILGSSNDNRFHIRDIFRNEDFEIELALKYNDESLNLKAYKNEINFNRFPVFSNGLLYNKLSNFFTNSSSAGNIWIINYWTSQTDNKTFKINGLHNINANEYLINSLSGIQENIKVVQLITFFDYLRTSENPKEKQEGTFLFEQVKKIIQLSLNEGSFKYVERKSLMPVVSQKGADVTLDKLSSGNLYLIQRMISLLGQMYSVYSLNNLELEEMLNTPGLLLIDEAENHLHPKWQKTFLNSILDIFPNLQIIATTHSPFIVSSVENARIYVCKSKGDHAIIEDETDVYSNKPIEEILVSDVFNTSPFSFEISQILKERDIAISQKDFIKSEKIEKQLQKLNPQYFSYFNIDKLLEQIAK